MKSYIMVLFLISGIASPFLEAQEKTSKYFSKDDLPSKAWIYEIDGKYIWAIVTKDKDKKLTYLNKNGEKKSISYDQVEKIKEGGIVLPSRKGKYFHNRGFYFTLFGTLPTGGSFTTSSQGIFGYRLSEKLSLGTGFSFDSYSDEFNILTENFFTTSTFDFASLFLYGRYNFYNKGPRIYGFARLGQGWGLDGLLFEEVFSNGINIHGGVGMVLASSNILRINIELGFAQQTVNGTYIVRDQVTNRDIEAIFNSSLLRPLLKIGVQFH